MAWTTRKIHIDKDTAEVLNDKDLWKYNLIEKKIIWNKLTETHTEKILIYEYRQSEQQRLF